MRHWSSREAADRYHRLEGFLVGWDICPDCALKMRAAHCPKARRTKLECARCGGKRVRFTEDK